MNSKHINMEGIGFILSGVFFFIIILWFWIYASESRCEGTYYTEEDNIGVTIDERICSSHSMGNLCGKMEKCKESLLSWKRMPVFMLIISFFIIYIGVNRRYGFEIDADALPFPAAMVLLPLLSYWSGEIGLLIFALVADIIIVIIFLFYLMVSYIKKRTKTPIVYPKTDEPKVVSMSENTSPLVNYTPKQIEELVNAYTKSNDQKSRDAVVNKFAKKFDKKPASIRARLANSGVYVEKTYALKDGDFRGKSELVDEIATLWGVQAETIDTLAKANRSVIELVLDGAKTKDVTSTIDFENSDHDTEEGVILSTQTRAKIIAGLLGIPEDMIESLKKASKGPIIKSLDSAQAFIDDYAEARNEDDRTAVIEKYAGEFGLSLDSIRSILPSENIYVAKTHIAEQNYAPSSKAAMIDEIALHWKISPESIDTLVKAEKQVIRHVLEDSRQFS